jgi:hypothetical protein
MRWPRRCGKTTPSKDVANDRWRAEALAVLNHWHQLESCVPQSFAGSRLGQAWPDVVRDYIHHLEALKPTEEA